jgi:hypothetical protein
MSQEFSEAYLRAEFLAALSRYYAQKIAESDGFTAGGTMSMITLSLLGCSLLSSVLLVLMWCNRNKHRKARQVVLSAYDRMVRMVAKKQKRIRDLEAAQEHLLEERGHFLVELQGLLREVSRAEQTHPCSIFDDGDSKNV